MNLSLFQEYQDNIHSSDVEALTDLARQESDRRSQIDLVKQESDQRSQIDLVKQRVRPKKSN